MEPLVLAALIMVTIVHALAAVSRPVTGYILSALKVVLLGVLTLTKQRATPLQSALMEHLPKDVRTAMKLLGVVPDIITYACCRKCFAIYEYDHAHPDEPYPRTCTHKEVQTSQPCGEPLVFENVLGSVPPSRSLWSPFRTYPYRGLVKWIAELLLRVGMELMIEESWKKAASSGSSWSDIMESPGIREFVGPDGKTRFSVQLNGDLHLVFAMSIDWFNPHGNKQAGKSYSIGVIYLACLNLPSHLRYRPENIFLAGVIPGPKEPDVTQLNHLLRPLVDELLQLWQPGILLQKTADTGGRRVRAAVIPLVCDLPALRKTAGFASHSATHFCSFCNLLYPDRNNVDRATWPPRGSWAEHLAHAKASRDAATDKVRQNIFDSYGIRWSELLRLPYWDPTRYASTSFTRSYYSLKNLIYSRYAPLDAMHNLFLGELRHHCIKIWGLKQAKSRTTPQEGSPHTPEQQEKALNRIVFGLSKLSTKTLGRVRLDYMEAALRYNGIQVPAGRSTRADYARALVDWVCPQLISLSVVLTCR